MTRPGAFVCSLLALGAWAAAACSRNSDPEPIRVSAAVSLTGAIQEVARAWRAHGGAPVVCNLAASNILARQIEEGAPVDLFVSADEAQMDRLVAAGLVAPADRVPLLSNQLVVVVPAGRLLPAPAPQGLADPRVERLALGDPAAVPAGVYAKQWLKQAGVWDAVALKLVPSTSVRAALAAVEAGNADAGVVYATDLFDSDRVIVAHRVPADEGPRIVYPAAVVADSERREAAARLLAFLQSPEASAIFERAGFVPLAAARTAP